MPQKFIVMSAFSIPIQLRWADIDQNRHLRHSVYYDYGAMMRMIFLSGQGLTTQKLEEFKVGPIILREEAIFRREIKLEDKITLDVQLLKSSADFSRWSLRHHFMKEGDLLAATINLDGAWIDLEKRKMAKPNEFIQHVFQQIPKSPEFELIPEKK